MKKYYLIYLDKTAKKDAWITLSRYNSNGYCWYKEWAGTFDKHNSSSLIPERDTIYVREDVLEDLWEPVYYEEQVRYVILNSEFNRKMLEIEIRQLSGRHTTLGLWEIIDKDFVERQKMLLYDLEQIPKNFLK